MQSAVEALEHRQSRDRPQQACGGERHGTPIGSHGSVACTEQCDVEGKTLWLGDLASDVVDHVAKEIAERGERHLRVRLDRPRGEHPAAALLGGLNPMQPDRGLADPWRTLDQGRGGPLGRGVEESRDGCELVVPSEDLVPLPGHVPPGGGSSPIDPSRPWIANGREHSRAPVWS